MTGFQDFLIQAHSFVRWFILTIAVVGAARSLVSLLTREAKFMRLDVGLSNAYGALLILLGLTGILLSATLSDATTMPWPYLIITIAALIIGNLHWFFRQRPDRVRHLIQLGIFVVTLILVIIGISITG